MGTALLAGKSCVLLCDTVRLISGSGGAGLVGGALLMDAFENHEDRVEEQAYDQGWSLPTVIVLAKRASGYNNGYDNGGGDYDNDGGDW